MALMVVALASLLVAPSSSAPFFDDMPMGEEASDIMMGSNEIGAADGGPPPLESRSLIPLDGQYGSYYPELASLAYGAIDSGYLTKSQSTYTSVSGIAAPSVLIKSQNIKYGGGYGPFGGYGVLGGYGGFGEFGGFGGYDDYYPLGGIDFGYGPYLAYQRPVKTIQSTTIHQGPGFSYTSHNVQVHSRDKVVDKAEAAVDKVESIESEAAVVGKTATAEDVKDSIIFPSSE